jgi:hypothetical protein
MKVPAGPTERFRGFGRCIGDFPRRICAALPRQTRLHASLFAMPQIRRVKIN